MSTIKKILIPILIIYLISSITFVAFAVVKTNKEESRVNNSRDILEAIKTLTQTEDNVIEIPDKNSSDEKQNDNSITISAAGDCTLGSDDNYSYKHSFLEEFHNNNNDYGYFMKNVKDIFKADDLTLVNLETALTNETLRSEKKFNFKGYPSFTKILTEGNIEAVDIANNHTKDYLEKGFKDTIENLEKAGIGYYGYENRYITEVKGIKIGVLGYKGWTSAKYQQQIVKSGINKLREDGCQLVIVNFHWGDEGKNYPNDIQKTLGRYAIDCGADLVLGHHPHVIQGIEKYKDKYIVYSLANFSFGGNKYGKDKDTFIFQQTFRFDTDKNIDNSNSSINIIPCSVSSIKGRNNFQPTPLTGEDRDRVIDRINTYSKGLNFEYPKDN